MGGIQTRRNKRKLACRFYFVCVYVLLFFFHMEKKIPPCLKRLHVFSCRQCCCCCIFFIWLHCEFTSLCIFIFILFFCCLFFFPHLPAYGRRKRAGVTDRKLSGPGNPGEACACGKWAAGGWKSGVPAVFHLLKTSPLLWHDSCGMYVRGMWLSRTQARDPGLFITTGCFCIQRSALT